MGKHLVLVGGGHAHMVTLANLHTFVERGHRVTVVQPSEHHYYSGMGPGMLGNTYAPEEIRFATRHVVEKQGGRFVLGRAERVLPEEKRLHLASGEILDYDLISFNAGSRVPRLEAEGMPESDLFTVKPIERLLEARGRILERTSRKRIDIAVVGGGPSSAEIAGNVWGLVRRAGKTMPVIRVFAGKKFMRRFPAGVGRKMGRSLEKRGVEIVENGRVTAIEAGRIRLSSGETRPADVVFLALGVRPAPIFEASGLPTGPDGGLLVNRFLQSPAHADIFGGGDCIYFRDRPLDKVGVYAVRENPVLYHNLAARLEGRPLQAFDPGGGYLLIFNLGDGTGVLRKWRFQLGGRIAFKIKDAIDRKFMRRFQALE